MRIRNIAAVGVSAALLGMLALNWSAPSADAATADKPVVVVSAGAGTVTTIQFEFPTSVHGDQARTVIDSVRRALGTTSNTKRAVVKNGVRRYSLDVNVATRESFARSRIAAAVWRKIAAAAHEPVVLDTRAGFRVVAGDVAKVHGGTTSRFDVTPDRDVVYGMSATLFWLYALVLVAIVVFAFAILRPYARRVEQRDGDVTDRAHLLQRLSMASLLGILALVGAVLLTGLFWVIPVTVAGVVPRVAGSRGWMLLATALGILVPLLAWGVSLGLAIQPSYRRLRGIDRKPSRRTRAGFLVMALAPFAFFTVARLVGGIFGSAGTSIAVVTYFVFILMLWPSLLVRILPTRPPSAELDAQFRSLCEREHARIRGIRVLEGRRTKTANAMLLGVGRFRYVLVTDYLLENLEPDSLDAVILHELAHAKQHHLLKKVGAGLGSIAVLEIALVLVVDQFNLSSAFVSAGFVFALPLSFMLANGWLGIRLETKADDFAADVVGPDALRRGLDCLAELNMTKRRTGRVWNLLTQHPGIQQRVDRLAARTAPGAQPRALSAKP